MCKYHSCVRFRGHWLFQVSLHLNKVLPALFAPVSPPGRGGGGRPDVVTLVFTATASLLLRNGSF